MNLERVIERLGDYRLQNEYFDRLVGTGLANKLAARAVRVVVTAPASGSRAGKTRRPGQ